MSTPERNDVLKAEKVIGRCQGCLKTAVLQTYACEACREKYGEVCGILFARIRSDAEFACQFWACLTPGKKAGFVRIFGDPGARVVKEESEKLLQQHCIEEQWTPEPALQKLASHICSVLVGRRSAPEDLVRATGMLRCVWSELTPERWRVLLRAAERHSVPELRELVRSRSGTRGTPTEAGATRGVPMMESNLAFIEPIGDHGVRVALEVLEHCAGLESMESDREVVHSAWVLLVSSRPWSHNAWLRAFDAASRRVEEQAPVGCATSLLVVAMARESRVHPGRAEQLEALAQQATASGAPWAAELDRVLTFRRKLSGKEEP